MKTLFLILFVAALLTCESDESIQNSTHENFSELNFKEFVIFEDYEIEMPEATIDTNFVDSRGVYTIQLLYKGIAFTCHGVGSPKDYINSVKMGIPDSIIEEVMVVDDTLQGQWRMAIDSKAGTIEYSLIDSTGMEAGFFDEIHNSLSISATYSNEPEKKFVVKRLKTIRKK